jgi:translation initiation factor 3 subunit C
MKINDWSAIQTLFDELNKRLDKARKVADNVGVPRVYLKMIVELEDFLTGQWGHLQGGQRRTSAGC